MKGYWNVDIVKNKGVDEAVDLNKDFPWEDNSIDEIYINCALEHLASVDHFMKESHRVLKNKGVLHIIVPHYSSGIAPHPYHINDFNFGWFKFYLIKSWQKGIYEHDSLDEFQGYKIISDVIHYKPIISWIPFENVKRQLIMMVGDLCSTIETRLEVVK
jgi:SAM-dependent methyltransferase